MRTKRCRAVTLIELLLGLSIFMLVATTLYAAFANGININRHSQETERAYREARWILDGLARDLENMVGYAKYPAFSGKALQGKNDRVAFVLPTPKGLSAISYSFQPLPSGRIHREEVRMSTGGNQSQVLSQEQGDNVLFLARTETLLNSREKEKSAGEFSAEILSELIKEGALHFYYGARNLEGSMDWKEEWDQEGFPAGIRVDLTLPVTGGKQVQVRRDILVPLGLWGEV